MGYFSSLKRFKKILIFFIIFFALIFVFSRGRIYSQDELSYGVTFSQKQAQAFGVDWRAVYSAMLNELGVKKIRLSAYWDEVEAKNNQYTWEDLDWQINEASKADTEVILAIGGRLPRWPECHFPDWAEDLTKIEREQEILEYIEKIVLRYIGEERIIAWQVENEPFLSHFGDCPEFSAKFLDKEIALVRSFDDRPIVITDSGELSVWIFAAKRADIFGTTMYQNTYSEALDRYINYPISPGFFRFKKNIARLFAHPDKWIVIELQAEPWGPIPIVELSREDKARTMDKEKFAEMLEFSRKAGFREFYLWGVEWWYWERKVNDNSDMWNKAKKLFK
ncbi:MAG: cellulase family glycosylhydrolase [Patescibacteria group bacterium]|nr:cellulase family glycosylhydrolase [Patescibacteria group bacterium]